MSTPTVTLKPSEEIIQAANAVEYVNGNGLKIGLKKPGILQQYRIVEIVGESAKNEVYMGMINPVLWVCEIDDVPEHSPTSKRQLEALIQRLGEEGVVAIAEYLAAKVAPVESENSLKN